MIGILLSILVSTSSMNFHPPYEVVCKGHFGGGAGDARGATIAIDKDFMTLTGYFGGGAGSANLLMSKAEDGAHSWRVTGDPGQGGGNTKNAYLTEFEPNRWTASGYFGCGSGAVRDVLVEKETNGVWSVRGYLGCGAGNARNARILRVEPDVWQISGYFGGGAAAANAQCRIQTN